MFRKADVRDTCRKWNEQKAAGVFDGMIQMTMKTGEVQWSRTRNDINASNIGEESVGTILETLDVWASLCDNTTQWKKVRPKVVRFMEVWNELYRAVNP